MESINILLCEDERLFALELEERLQGLGHKVVAVASNAAAAIEKARECHPDLALMDMHLEDDSSGSDAAKILQTELKIPSIYLTAYADEATVSKARQTRPLAYLTKPVRDLDLRMAIEFGYGQYRLQKVLQTQLGEYQKFLEEVGYLDKDAGSPQFSMQRFRSRMEAAGSIVGGLAHHVNNALTVTSGYVQWLLESETLGDFERRQVKRALDACTHQGAIIQQLLWASQQGAQMFRPISLRDCVAQVLEQLADKIPASVKIKTQIGPEHLGGYVDEEAVSSAITSVITNAIEATEVEGGTVTVELVREHQEVPERFNTRALPGWYGVIRVMDTGKGISPKEINEVFDPFFTTHPTRNALGLGLSVVYGVMQMHGGWVAIESRPAEGSTVSLYFPLTEDA
jgi:signal transduction histidine kinase